jgi:ABC-type multidrug transport system ATPase subunit
LKAVDKISCVGLGKRYNREWIFRDIHSEFLRGTACAVLGHNGSGKSTFIQIVSGSMLESEGKVVYESEGKTLAQENIYKFISYSAPYLELVEEFSLAESIKFQSKFKGFIDGMTVEEVLEKSGLKKDSGKQIKYFSSGMKQRVKLTLSILADTPVVFLDEPASNLDKAGIDWYRGLIEAYRRDRFVFVCSNQQPHEFDFCEQILRIEDYKKK